ncbi:MAG: hypothetical protein QM820_61745 [Minicystis sp.]
MSKIANLLALALPALVLPALAFPGAAAADEIAPAAVDLEQVATDACTGPTGASFGVEGACTLSGFTRRAITFSVAEYSMKLKVGPGPYDFIGLHRVVHEWSPGRPTRTDHAVMMAHGDLWGFDAAFLAGGPDSLPVYLAEHGVDVWGIDFGWSLVPPTETDTSFMAHWGVDHDIADLRTALGVARAVRNDTLHDNRRFTLLGWSRGGQIGYGYLSEEARRPLLARHVGGYIPVDIYLKTDDESLRALACSRLADRQAQLDAAVYADPTGNLVATLGNLAANLPDDPSPLNPALSNYQMGLVVGAATFTLQGGKEPTPFYHWTGGVFDEYGIPKDLAYTDARRLLDLESAAAPYQPVQLFADAEASTCDDPRVDVGFDDYLDAVTVPVLYVGADGGFGDYGLYTLHLLGSSDVSTHIVDLLPPEARIAEIGHADIFLGEQAETLFWDPILGWLQSH